MTEIFAPTRLSSATQAVADMKATKLGHREIETTPRTGREFYERLGFSEEEKRAGKGGKEGTEGGR